MPPPISETVLEQQFIGQLEDLKYAYRIDIRDRAALHANFREKFESLNRVKLTDKEFERLLHQVNKPDVFLASRSLRERDTFEREDGTPLHFELVNTRDWCKNTFEVINQLRMNTTNSFHRYDVVLLLNGIPVVQVELKQLSVNPRKALEQIVAYKADGGNGYTNSLLCFLQIFVVSNQTETYYFANNNDRHFTFNVHAAQRQSFLLHDNSEDKTKDYNLPLLQMRKIVGTAASLRFDQLLREGTPPALFKAFHDLYLDGLKAEVRPIFLHLSEIGRANEALVGAPYLEWAYSYTKELIAYHKHSIRIWVRNVCDEQPYDPNEDDEEAIFWRKWQAPMFLIMKPSRYKPYDAATAWSRKDAKESAKLLDHFEDDYILRLKLELDRVHGSEAVRLAKQAKPQVGAPPLTDAKSADPAATEITASKPASVLREARKLGTKKKHKAWQKKYKALLKSNPGKSDVWYSEKIARSTNDKRSSPETIRKNMK